MTSEIRVNKIENRSGLGTVTFADTGVDLAGITTVATLRATTGIVTSLTAVSSAKVGSGVTLSPDGDAFFTGVCTATSFVGDGSALTGIANTDVVFTDKLSVGDAPELISVGVGSDFQINHNGGTGNTNIIQQTGSVYFYTGSDLNLLLKDGAEVALYHANTKQCETSANGLAFPSGKGIDFSATSDAGGMTSELLDDYEEGTWTPDLRVADYLGNANQFTYSTRTGVYTKIGREVHINAYWQVSNYHSYSGALYLFGFPFAPVRYATNISPILTIVGDGANLGANDMMFAIVDGANDRADMGHQQSSGWSRLAVSEVDQYGMYLSGTYTA